MLSVVGSGPGAAAVTAALADREAEIATDIETVDRARLAVVVGPTGDGIFEQANERALDGETPWLAVEQGGLGGLPVADAAVTPFAPGRGCYDCLRTRVRANHDPDEETEQGDGGADPATARLAGAVAGHEAVRHLDGTDIFERVLAVPYTEHPLLPVPGCDCNSTADRSVRRGHTDRGVEAALERAERALDELVGVVSEVGEAESFPVPYYLARLSDTAGFSSATAARNAAGVDPDWNRAFMKALGEALERYCAGVYRTDRFEHGTPAAVANAVDPAAFVCKNRPDGEAIRWVPGGDLIDDETVALPAAFVHHPPPERRYRPPVTTGLGFGNSGVEALLSGLYEVVERDAAMLAWYSSFDPLELAVETDPVETMRSRAASERLDVTLLVVTMDIDVPVIVAAVHREEWPRFAAGTAANLDAGVAAASALSEALQNWVELRGMGPERAEAASGAIGRYADLPDAVAAFLDTEVTVDAGSISAGPLDGEAELEAVLDRLSAAGLAAYAARTTTRDVDALGFEAVRALVPAAQPLAFGDMYFGERAETVPASLGFEPRLDRDHHPFP
ncbi:MAG: ribosomal protein S12 methylthiotransferase accessory factor [Halovenus sp.]|jgi:ribosomal protein S12 methylthiotransferase accessory factor